ncbi:MAG: hypothetical protein EXS35_19035, partial [Pedosphaera sp.]|nr:hypothetical protein [Pedosphaera sp.]
PDAAEQRIAREQLQQMVHYAEIGECRRAALLDYFGEEYPGTECGGCDNCLIAERQKNECLSLKMSIKPLPVCCAT